MSKDDRGYPYEERSPRKTIRIHQNNIILQTSPASNINPPNQEWITIRKCGSKIMPTPNPYTYTIWQDTRSGPQQSTIFKAVIKSEKIYPLGKCSPSEDHFKQVTMHETLVDVYSFHT